MPRVVVLDAGIGGVPMAFELREKLGRKVDIDVVSESEWFQFVPSNPWVAVSWRKPEDVKSTCRRRCCSTTGARCLTTIL